MIFKVCQAFIFDMYRVLIDREIITQFESIDNTEK